MARDHADAMAVAAPTRARDYCLAPERVDAPIGEGGRYGRMFDLPALEADETLLHRIGAAGGFCDGGDCEGDANVEAGWPLFGQYVAHAALHRGAQPLVDRLREDGVAESEVFDDARRALTWHYQWAIVDDFLPLLVGQELVDELLADGARFYRPEGEPYIPVEFADAAYRYGHSQIRQMYQLQAGGPLYPVFPDLMGFRPISDRRVDWSLFFDLPGRPPTQRAKPMDGVLPRSLVELPQAITGAVTDEAYRSLAARDLERGQGTGLPSGEAVARAMGVETLSENEVGLRAHGWEGETPLWLYVLRESAARHGGDRLGEVGGRIVAEVLVEVVRRDPESFLTVDPDWAPTLPARGDRFRLADLLG